MMKLYALFAFVLAYTVYVCYRQKGIPESLSATYYLLEGHGWLTQLVFILTGFLLLPGWLAESVESLQFLAFLACASLVFVGCAPMFKLPLEGAVHYTSAAVCCISSVLWVILMGYYPTVICCAFIGFMGYVRFGQYMWWLEMAVIGMVFASLL